MKELLMGNEAVAVGALLAGVSVVTGYPGTPSTEVLETVAKRRTEGVYVEWSANEKAALEVAAGAAYSGARALVTMKQVGLNVASDPLMCVNYVGIKGGLVVYVADDPGPISSQTEQDTRHFGEYAHIPVFDCTSPEEAFVMIGDAFDFSEKSGRPVIFRSTTRICHSCASIDVPEILPPKKAEGFVKDSRWVIFPRLSFESKKALFARESALSSEFSEYKYNTVTGNGKIGIAVGGVSTEYAADAISGMEDKFTVFKVATPYPFPKEKAESFLKAVESVIVFEELDPVIEDALTMLKGSSGLTTPILGKRTGSVITAGELGADKIKQTLTKEFNIEFNSTHTDYSDAPKAPVRPPVLCAGCPHRASFYAVKTAMKGQKAVFCGDIGCYTLGNAMPLDMVDTCLCMGAGITVAQGIDHAGNNSKNFAFIGDSTFFASGMTGVANAVYNNADVTVVVLDNSTTAMTGHQPHPGIGKTMMNTVSPAIVIEKVLKGIGVEFVKVVDPLDQAAAVSAVKEAAELKGVKAIIFKSPCVAITKPKGKMAVENEKCVGCRKCINELGCPALSMDNKKAIIDSALCTGCGLCSSVCPTKSIKEVK